VSVNLAVAMVMVSAGTVLYERRFCTTFRFNEEINTYSLC